MATEDEAARPTPAFALTDPLVEGYLDKKRPAKKMMSVKYQKRWCVIKGGYFYYYEKHTDKQQRGSFCLAGFHFAKTESSNLLGFTLTAKEKEKRGFEFLASSLDEVSRWKSAVEQSIQIFANRKGSAPTIATSAKSLWSKASDRRTDLSAARSLENLDLTSSTQSMGSPRQQKRRNTLESTPNRSTKDKFSLSLSKSVPPVPGNDAEYMNYGPRTNSSPRVQHIKKPMISKNSIEEEDDSSDSDYIDVEQSAPPKKPLCRTTKQPSLDDDSEYQNIPYQTEPTTVQNEDEELYLDLM